MRIKLRISQALRAPAFGIAVLTPIVLAGAVAGAPQQPTTAVTSAAPVASPGPQPKVVGLSPSVEHNVGVRIPPIALSAYRKAEQTMAAAAPGCGVSWSLLAGIGRIEAPRGANIRQTDAPAWHASMRGNAGGRPAQAMGPMKLLPGTWSRFASDGDGDGKSDPQNLSDAALTTARYLCSGGLNLRDEAQAVTAVLRYNNSMVFAQNVLGWAAAYATGFAPLTLPPIFGAVPKLGPGRLPAGPGPGRTSFEPATQLAFGNTTQAAQMMPGTVPGPGPAAAVSAPPEPLPASQAPPAPALAAPQPPAPWVAPPPSPGGTAPAGTGNAGSSRPAVEPKIAPPPDVAPESQPQPQRRRAEQTAADSAVQPSAQSPDKNDKRDAGGGRGKKNSR